MSKAEWENNEEIKIFREYLRIPTVHPNVDYSESADSIKIVSYLYRWNISSVIKLSTFYSCLHGILETSGSQPGAARGCALPS